MWVRFTRRHIWKANEATNIVYRPTGGPLHDGRYSVTRECATDAVAKGAASKVPAPKRQK